MVESTGLLNLRRGNSTGGSNPPLSAKRLLTLRFLFSLLGMHSQMRREIQQPPEPPEKSRAVARHNKTPAAATGPNGRSFSSEKPFEVAVSGLLLGVSSLMRYVLGIRLPVLHFLHLNEYSPIPRRSPNAIPAQAIT